MAALILMGAELLAPAVWEAGWTVTAEPLEGIVGVGAEGMEVGVGTVPAPTVMVPLTAETVT